MSTNPRPISRRLFLGAVGVAGASATLGAGVPVASAGTRALTDPFQLGVASGDPLPTSVLLWTRLAPKPLDYDGGVPDRNFDLQWEIAGDEKFRGVVKRGVETVRPSEAHSAHVDVRGLEPHREYFYRFRVGNEISPVGRTRTAPAPGTAPDIDFAFVSCSNWEQGYFTAFSHLADERPDLVFHLGDYIYEYTAGHTGDVRAHVGGEINTLDEYRQRHSQYRTDTDLQRAHAAAPFVVTWDDHEVDNDYTDLKPENEKADEFNDTEAHFAARRKAAYQAYWENMPLRRFRKPVDTKLPLYRKFEFGETATFSVLDTRQYRSDQPYDGKRQVSGPEQSDPSRSMLGDEQHEWLEQNLSASRSQWNVVPQQVFFAQWDEKDGSDPGGYNDGWDGYQHSRERILGYVEDREIDNFVVLTGDVHQHWANDLRRDFEQPDLPVLGTEFICTSISSGGDGDANPMTDARQTENPHAKYYSNRRGYVSCKITTEAYRTDFKVVDYVEQKGAPIRTDQSFVIESGKTGLNKL